MTYDIYAIDRLSLVDSCLKELGIERTPENLKAVQALFYRRTSSLCGQIGLG